MKRVVTIVARPPRECEDCPEDTTIERVFEKIEAEKQEPHVIERAATLREVGAILLRERPNAPELVQIIGHGSPGALLLGGSWPIERVRRRDARYELNSNLDDYLVLQGCVAPETSVWLLGCAVGPVAEEGSVGDGPTLLFDLVRLWRCKAVAAPVTMVIRDDFKQGVYWRKGTLSQAQGMRVTIGQVPDDDDWKKSVSFRPLAPGIGCERRAA